MDDGMGPSRTGMHPIVNAALLGIAAFSAAAVLFSISPWLLYVAQLVAVLLALTLWILHFDKGLAAGLYANPLGRPVLDTVCDLTGERRPGARDPGLDTGAPLPFTAPSPARLEPVLSAKFPRQPDLVGPVLEKLRARCELRAQLVGPAREPLASLLLLGRPALGKRSLAEMIGLALFGADRVQVIDARGTPGAVLRAIREAVDRHRGGVIVLEDVDKAQPDTLSALGPVLARGSFVAPGDTAATDCTAAIVVLLVHRDARTLAPAQAGILNDATERYAAASGLPKALVASLDLCHPVSFPSPHAVLDVLRRLMEGRAAAYGLEIGIEDRALGMAVARVRLTEDFSGAEAIVKELSEPAIQTAKRLGRSRAEIKADEGEGS